MISTLSSNVVLIIQVLRLLLGLVLRLFTVDEVQSLGLGEFVDLRTRETDEELLGELVRDWLA